jgi:flagellar export protein FliJ
MKAFQFRLQRVLEYRAVKLMAEERKLLTLRAEFEELGREIARLGQESRRCETALSRAKHLTGRDLALFAAFRESLLRRRTVLEGDRSRCMAKLHRQTQNYLTASRDHKLLEKLRSRRLAEWTREADRQTDHLASELYLAHWRQDASSVGASRPGGLR